LQSIFRNIFIAIFILINVYGFTEESISIGLIPPFMKNDNAVTVFFNKHFVFEILFNYNISKYTIDSMNIDSYDEEDDYIDSCKSAAIKQNFDYLLYSSVSTNDEYLYFKVELLNPYNNTVIFSKLYKNKNFDTINEILSDISIDVIKQIGNAKLVNIAIKKKIDAETAKKKEKPIFNEYFIRSKHEIFIMQGFFKNHPGVMSFIEIMSGYGFSPNNFVSIEGGIYLGYGKFDIEFRIQDIDLKNIYLGTFGGFDFFISGLIEPCFGLKLDITYIVNNNLYLSLPIDFGLKINLFNKYCIKFNASFQFIAYDFNKLSWENNYIIGIFIGYAQKI